MPKEADDKELEQVWLSFLYSETIEYNKHSVSNYKQLAKLDKSLIFEKILGLEAEKKQAVMIFLYQHTNSPPLPYRVVAKHFKVDIFSINGILSYGRYIFFNILENLINKTI